MCCIEQGWTSLICTSCIWHQPRRPEALGHPRRRVENPKHEGHHRHVGKYTDLTDSCKSLNEALRHAGIHNHASVNIEYVDPRDPTPRERRPAGQFDAILVPGGFGKRGVEGKILAAQLCPRARCPYLGICLGMQVATIEFAPRHMAGLEGANSTEFDPGRPPGDRPDRRNGRTPTAHPEKARRQDSDLGGTMRLGAQSSTSNPARWPADIYGPVVTERHRHRYEANVTTSTACSKPGW